MAGYEEVARISAIIEANSAPFEQALARGEQRGQAFASRTEAVMERAERSVEEFGRSTSSAMARAGAAQVEAGSASRRMATQTTTSMRQAETASRQYASRVATDSARAAAAHERAAGKMAGFTRTLAIAGATAGAYTLGRAVTETVRLSASLEQNRIAFGQMLGSAKAADDFLSKLQTFAARTPFEFTDLTMASRRMMALGFSARDVIPMLTDIGDAVGALGGGSFEIDRVVRALGQMQAKQKVSAEEMMQLSENGINGWKYLSDELGISVPDAMKKAERGVIDGATGVRAVLKGMEKDFGGGMERQADSLAGRWSNVMDVLKQRLAATGTSFHEELKARLAQAEGYIASPQFASDAQAVMGAVMATGEALADTTRFVYQHRDAIIALGSAYVALRAASAGASLLGAMAGGRGGMGLAGMAMGAGEAAVTAGPKLLTFARIAGTAARGLTAIGLGTIAAQALWSLAHSGDEAATSAAGASDRIAKLRAQLDDMPARKVTEVIVKTKHVNGDKKGGGGKTSDPAAALGNGVDVTADNAGVFREIAREHEQAVDRVAAAYKRQRDAREEAERASGRVIDARLQYEQRLQEFLKAGLSEVDAVQHPEIEGLGKQLEGLEKAADDARDKVSQTNGELAKSKDVAAQAGKAMEEAYRKLAGVGKNAKGGDVEKMLGGWSKEKLIQKLGVADVNAAMKKLGYVEISGNWYDSFNQYHRLVKKAADGTPKDVNRLLKLIGATDTSGQARARFLADIAAMRAEARQKIVIRTYLETHKSTINDPKRQQGTHIPGAATGGLITGPGTGTSDDVLARLSNGEYVVRAAMVDKYGEQFLDALNRGALPAYAGGGRVRPSGALRDATRQAGIDASPLRTLRQAERQYNAALAAVKKIQQGGVSESERDKFKNAKITLADRAAALVDARQGLADARRQQAEDRRQRNAEARDKAQAALLERTDLAFSAEDATNRQGSLLARGTAGLGDDIAAVDAQRGSNSRRIDALRKDIASTKNEDTKRALTEKLNAAIEQQISLDTERTQLIDQQNAAAREAALDVPRSRMALIDAVRDLEMAKAEATADPNDDKAVRERAIADEQQRQALIQSVLGRGDLTEEERAAKIREMAASVRTVSQLTQALEQSVATPTESQQFMDSTFAGSGGGGSGGADAVDITRTGGGGSGVGYVPDPENHPVFFGTDRLNDLDFDAEFGVGVKLMQINGWDEGEDQRVATEDRAGQDGEHAREMLLGGSTVKIRGIIAGSSLSDLWARRKALKRALQPSREEKVLKMPDPTYGGAIATTYAAELEGYQRKACRVVEGVTWGERHGRFGHWFEVTLRASDPRRYSDVTVTETTGAISTGGGMASPMSSPLSSSSSGTGGVASFTNDGDYDTPMILRVHANGSQVVNPVIEGSDWQIVFDGLTINAVDYLEIDPVERTAFLNGDEAANRFQYVDYGETTWGLLGEDANTVRLRGSSISDPSYLEIEYRPASL